jgi:mercuric ion transport protein
MTDMMVKNDFVVEFQRAPVLLAASALAGALAASSCCIPPLVLFSIGVSGAWIGNLTQLAPYQPYFIAVTLAALGTGYCLVHCASTRACADGAACARPLPSRLVKAALVVATILVCRVTRRKESDEKSS